MARYRNKFYDPRGGRGPEFFETDARPVEYRGYVIYARIPSTNGGGCWDVLLNGELVGQFAGPNGARRGIDEWIQDAEQKQERA